MKLLATSVGKNVWVCMQRCRTLTRIWASKAADTSWLAEIHLKYTCFHRFGKGLAKSPTSLSLVSFAVASLCVLYAHSGCKKTESQFEDNSLENSRGVAVNNIRCFLVGGERIQKISLLFSRSAQSPPLPEIPQRLRKSVPRVERIENPPPRKGPLSEKYPPTSAHLKPIPPRQRSLNSVRIPAGDSDTLHGSFSKCCGAKQNHVLPPSANNN